VDVDGVNIKFHRSENMKLTIIHDTGNKQGADILNYLKDKSRDSKDDILFFDLAEQTMEPCTGCFNCWVKTPGVCIFKDDTVKLLREEILSDRVLYLCPVTWGSYSPAMKIFQDRSLGRVLPFFKTVKGETHHPHRYAKSAKPYLAGYGNDLSVEETELFIKTGANLNDNIHGGEMNTVIIRDEDGLSQFDGFFLGEEQ